MSALEKRTTIVSMDEQVILPKTILGQRGWRAGTRLAVEDTPGGVLLTEVPLFEVTKPEDVFGSLPYRGTPKSLDEMEAGIAAEAKCWHARG